MNVTFPLRKFVRFNIFSLAKRTVMSQGGVKNEGITSPFLSCETGFNKNDFVRTRTSCMISDANVSLLSENISNLTIKNGILRSKITEPGSVTEINVGLPFFNLVINDLTLPNTRKWEIIDPNSNVVEKQAKKNMMRIRRKKMKRHKYKKLQKKMRFIFAKIKKRRRARKEKEFLGLITDILESGENYNPEKELEENIKMLQWQRPVTHVRGFLAPKSVVDQYLKEEELKRQIKEKVEECLEKMS